jgi:hypothetical protein
MIHQFFLGRLVAKKGKTGIAATCLIIAIIPPKGRSEPIGRTSSTQQVSEVLAEGITAAAILVTRRISRKRASSLGLLIHELLPDKVNS